MNADQARLYLLEAKIRMRVPKFEVRGKNESGTQRAIGALLFFVKYMTQFVSTFYPIVWWTTLKEYGDNPWPSFKTLAHEYVHLLDIKAKPMRSRLGYAMPQLLASSALVSAVAIFHSNWWLIALCALGFLAPFPAIWRARFEMRGYTMSMAVNAWKHGTIEQGTKDWIRDVFTGWPYYRMTLLRKTAERRIAAAEQSVINGDVLLESVAFQDVKEICDLTDADAVKAAQHAAKAAQ